METHKDSAEKKVLLQNAHAAWNVSHERAAILGGQQGIQM